MPFGEPGVENGVTCTLYSEPGARKDITCLINLTKHPLHRPDKGTLGLRGRAEMVESGRSDCHYSKVQKTRDFSHFQIVQ